MKNPIILAIVASIFASSTALANPASNGTESASALLAMTRAQQASLSLDESLRQRAIIVARVEHAWRLAPRHTNPRFRRLSRSLAHLDRHIASLGK